MRFVGHLFMSHSYEFYYDNIIILTLIAIWTQSVSVVFYWPVLFRKSSSIKWHCELREKWTVSEFTRL